MGADKADMTWSGVTARDRCLALARAVGADPVLTVGAGGDVEDDIPVGGPVGGVVAGVRVLQARGCDRVLVLAVDAPTITPTDLGPLLDAGSPGAAYGGLHLPMVADIAALPSEAEPGWPMVRLLERSGLARPDPTQEARPRLRGANTPEERAALLAMTPEATGAQESGGH